MSLAACRRPEQRCAGECSVVPGTRFALGEGMTKITVYHDTRAEALELAEGLKASGVKVTGFRTLKGGGFSVTYIAEEK